MQRNEIFHNVYVNLVRHIGITSTAILRCWGNSISKSSRIISGSYSISFVNIIFPGCRL